MSPPTVRSPSCISAVLLAPVLVSLSDSGPAAPASLSGGHCQCQAHRVMQAVSYLGPLPQKVAVVAPGSRHGRVSGMAFCLFGHIQEQL